MQSSLDNKNDIEANFIDIGIDTITNTNTITNSNTNTNTNTNTYTNTNTNTYTDTTSFESNDDKTGIYCVKFTIVFIFLLFGLPLGVCDLYYAYNDNSCVSSHVDRINVNLKEYLQISGLLTICLLFIIILETLFYENLKDNLLLTIGTILLIPITIFNIVWNIIGGVIFWSYMDNSLCSNNVFNYVFTSIIIKYVCTIINFLFNKKDKKK
jgi:hypothetical protein